MIRHQQAQTAMPDELVVIVRHCREHALADVRAAELVFMLRHAFDGDEKPTAFGHPLWDSVREFFPNRQIHEPMLEKPVAETSHKAAKVGRPGCD